MAANPLHRKSARGCVACHSKVGAMGSEAEGASESAVLRVFEQLCGVDSNDTVGPTNAGSAHNRKSQTLQKSYTLTQCAVYAPGRGGPAGPAWRPPGARPARHHWKGSKAGLIKTKVKTKGARASRASARSLPECCWLKARFICAHVMVLSASNPRMHGGRVHTQTYIHA